MPDHDRETVQQLQDAFEAFNQVSHRLSRSYQALEEKVARLTRELAQARSEKLQQLAEKERLAARLQHLIQALPGGVLVVDGDGVVQEVNAGACELLGEPLVGRRWEEVAAASFRATGDALELDDGRFLSLSTGELGEEGEQVVLLSDITETRRLQALLMRRERLAALGEMSAGLAHQIRTPLASVLLYLSQLDAPALDPVRRSRFVGRARERLRHLEQTVNNMLAYARGGAGNRESVSLRWLVEQFVQMMEPALSQRQGEILVEGGALETGFHGDGDALLGALVNLGTNAIEACTGTPRLKLMVGVAGDTLTLSLEDNGPGIPPSLREKVLEPFFTTRARGTGLGLAVVRAVVEGHDGTLQIGEGAGGGACVTLRLPLGTALQALPSGAANGHGEARVIHFEELAGGTR